MARQAKKTRGNKSSRPANRKRILKAKAPVLSTAAGTSRMMTAMADNQFIKKFPVRWVILGGLLLILAYLGVQNKGLFVAATVNGQPVWRLSLEQQLNRQYASQTLDEIIQETLISQAATQKKIVVTKSDVDAKQAELEKTLNGKISLQDALAQQGETVEGFRHQLELRIMLERLTADQVNVTDQEITDYIDQNKATLTATDEAGLKAEAKQIITANKQNTAFRQFFADLKAKAKISKFL